MSSHAGTTIVGGFPQVKEVVAEELGGQPHEAPQILTFSLSKASPGACQTHLPVRVFNNLCLQIYCALMYRNSMEM
jgi:hypothetical protein